MQCIVKESSRATTQLQCTVTQRSHFLEVSPKRTNLVSNEGPGHARTQNTKINLIWAKYARREHFKNLKNNDFLPSPVFKLKYFESPLFDQNSAKTDPWRILRAFRKILYQQPKLLLFGVTVAAVPSSKGEHSTNIRNPKFLIFGNLSKQTYLVSNERSTQA